MTLFEVLKAGPLTTVQDLGRSGQKRLGLSEGGPMDVRSFVVANLLVGNPASAAALEITFGGLKLQSKERTTIAVTGGYAPLLINGKAVALWKSHHLNPGDIVELHFAALGTRLYLAVLGGFDTVTLFDSQATVVREGLINPIGDGDTLKGTRTGHGDIRKLPHTEQPRMLKKLTLRYVPGYQAEALAEASEQFSNQTFAISAQNDRMGIRLKGNPLKNPVKQMYSEGIARGSIQVTGNGQVIVMMSDRQTIGGYAKLGAVISEDMDALGQATMGTEITFEAISTEQSIQLYRAYRQRLNEHLPVLLEFKPPRLRR